MSFHFVSMCRVLINNTLQNLYHHYTIHINLHLALSNSIKCYLIYQITNRINKSPLYSERDFPYQSIVISREKTSLEKKECSYVLWNLILPSIL